jgi:uncharacterized lipoprotein YajG
MKENELRADDVVMKPHYFPAAVMVALSVFAVAGCAENQQTTTTSTNTNPAARTYTGSDLQRTGRQTSGEALQAADPSVTTR